MIVSEFQQAEKLLDIKPPKDIEEEFYKLKLDVQLNLNSPYSAKETALKLIKLEPIQIQKQSIKNYQEKPITPKDLNQFPFLIELKVI